VSRVKAAGAVIKTPGEIDASGWLLVSTILTVVGPKWKVRVRVVSPPYMEDPSAREALIFCNVPEVGMVRGGRQSAFVTIRPKTWA